MFLNECEIANPLIERWRQRSRFSYVQEGSRKCEEDSVESKCESLFGSGVQRWVSLWKSDLSILEGMVTSDPKNVQAISDVASVTGSMGVAHRPDAAMSWNEHALTLYENLAARGPGSMRKDVSNPLTNDHGIGMSLSRPKRRRPTPGLKCSRSSSNGWRDPPGASVHLQASRKMQS